MDKTSKTATKPIIGIHVDCGGEVIYVSSTNYGMRVCTKCTKSSMRGSVEIVEDKG